MLFKRKYPVVFQNDISDCGAACISTIAEYYGLRISVTKVRELAGTDTGGTTAFGLITAARSLGFEAKGVEIYEIEQLAEMELPVIAHVVIDNKLMHYVVIYSIDKGVIKAGDPREGMTTYTFEEFKSIWTGRVILMKPGKDFKKGEIGTGVFPVFLSLLKSQKKKLSAIFIISLIYTALGIAGTFFIKYIFDDILVDKLIWKLNFTAVVFLSMFLVQQLFNLLRSFLLVKLSVSIDSTLMLEYYKHVLKLPMRFFSSRKVGEIISRFMDASRIREAISGATLTLMIDSVMAAAGGIILYIINPVLFFISVIILLIYAVLVMFFKNPVKNINKVQMENNAELSSYIVESLEGIETVKVCHAEEKAEKETEKRFNTLIKSVLKGSYIDIALVFSTVFISGAGAIIILWAGAYQVITGKISAGQLLAFNSLLVYFLDPVKHLINLQTDIQTAVVAAKRLGEILELEKEKELEGGSKAVVPLLSGKIEYKNVCFRYGGRKPVLRNVNLSIEPGERVAVVGESGSGKTTLAKLLIRLYPVESGQISISGVDIRDMELSVLRERISFVPQNSFLFSGTIRENIRFNCINATDREIIDASRTAGAHDFIESLQLKYDTPVGENGVNLSGGQKQRIALARALLRKPDILILDEATSNLDPNTEKIVANAIRSLDRKMTIIVISHRASTISSCDRILALENGEIESNFSS